MKNTFNYEFLHHPISDHEYFIASQISQLAHWYSKHTREKDNRIVRSYADLGIPL